VARTTPLRCLRWLAVPALAAVAGSCQTVAAPPAPGANVLVVVVDSLRCDRLRPWNPQAPVPVPNLERLAAAGTLYSNAWAVTPWTAPSVVSLFTGLYPSSHGVSARDDTTASTLPTLPRLLAGRGYRLGNLAFFSGISYFRNLGFPEPPPGLGHQHAVAELERFLAGPEPFCIWVHLVETHLPYGASGYEAREVRVHGSSGLEAAQLDAEVPLGSVTFAEGDRERLVELYDRDVAELDRALGRILDALAARGLDRRTLLVLAADHGEELLDHGWVGHASTSLEAKLTPEILHAPLLLAGPGVPAGVIDDRLVQQVDLLPTLCRLLGLPLPTPVDGVPLLPRRSRQARRLAFFDSTAGGNLTPDQRQGERLQGVTDGRFILSARTRPGGREEVELRPVAGDGGPPPPGLERRLARGLDRWRRSQARQRMALLGDLAEAPPPDPATVDGWPESLAVTAPGPGARLRVDSSAGQVVLEWSGPGRRFLVAYAVGVGVTAVRGSFPVEGRRVAFGPFPVGFWNDLASHNPYRFRVVTEDPPGRSPWVEFSLEPAAAEAPR
jgi:choline-sulfatase